jgi:hypothetical protein
MNQLAMEFNVMTKSEFNKQPIRVLRLPRGVERRTISEGFATIGQLYTYWENNGDFVTGDITARQSSVIAAKLLEYQQKHPECFGWMDEVWV